MSVMKTIAKGVNGTLIISDKLAGATKEAIFGDSSNSISEKISKGFSRGLLNALGSKPNSQADLMRKYIITIPMIVPSTFPKRLIFALQQAQQARIVSTMVDFFRTRENFYDIADEFDALRHIKRYMENSELVEKNLELFSEMESENYPVITVLKESNPGRIRLGRSEKSNRMPLSHIYNSAYVPISISYGTKKRSIKIGLRIVSFAIPDEEIKTVLSDFTNKFSSSRGFKSFLKGERSFMNLLFASDYISLVASVTKIMGSPWINRIRKGTFGTSLAISMDMANELKEEYNLDLFKAKDAKLTVEQLSIFDMYIIDLDSSLIYSLENKSYQFSPYDMNQVYKTSSNIINEAKITFTNSDIRA